MTADEKIDFIYKTLIEDHQTLINTTKDIKRINEEGCKGNEEKIKILDEKMTANKTEHTFIKAIAYTSGFFGTIISGIIIAAYYLWSMVKH